MLFPLLVKEMVVPILVRLGFVSLVVGKALVYDSTVTPAKVANEVVAPFPSTFCPTRRVAAPA